jgi:ParB/RepB/Spo0J family partition protein
MPPKKAATPKPAAAPVPTKGRLKAALRKPAAADAPAPDAAAPDDAGAGVRLLPLSALAASDLNPRKSFDHDDLVELAASIAAQGLLQNLVVRADPDAPGRFRLVAGERRFRALHLLAEDGRWNADAATVPVRVVDADDGQHLALAILENLQRKDINPMEEADGFARLHDLDAERWSTAAIAAAIGATQRHVQQRLALVARLGPDAKEALREGAITVSEARAMTAAAPEVQAVVVHRIRDEVMDRGADAVRDALSDQTFLARHALFGRLEYNGPIVEDPDSGEPVFTDMVQVRILQMQAVDARAAELRAAGCFVVVVDKCWHAPTAHDWNLREQGLVPWPEATPLPDGAQRAAVLAVMRADLSVVELRDVAKMAKAKAVAAERAAAAAVDPVAAIGTGERIWCRNARTRALQHALFDLDGRRTLTAHLCMALMGAPDALLAVRPTHLDPDTRTVAPRVAAVFDRFHAFVAGRAERHGLKTGPLADPDDREPWPRILGDAAFVLGCLGALPPGDLDDLAAALLAARAGTWVGDAVPGDGDWGPKALGDKWPALAAADALGLEAAGGHELLAEDFLAKLDARRLDALAWAVGYLSGDLGGPGTGWAKAGTGQKRAVLADWIAANRPDHLPPQMRFLSSSAMAAAIRGAGPAAD